MRRQLPFIVVMLITFATIGLFAASGHFGATVLIRAQQVRALDNLGTLVIRRTESALNFASDAVDQLESRELVGCDPATMQAIRFRVYQLGTLKDIRLTRPNGSVRCSALPETLEFDRAWPNRSEMIDAGDGEHLLFRVDQYNQSAIGVMRDIDEETSIVAVLPLPTSALDVLPEELQQSANVLVRLSNQDQLASLYPANLNGNIAPFEAFTLTSDKYPVTAEIRVDLRTLSHWCGEIYWPMLSLVTALGLAIALLLMRLMLRPESPIAEIDRALAAQEFKPFMQPIFRLDTGRIVGAEMLARWVKPNGEIIPPFRFIKLAEESGRIEAMTWQLLSAALEQMYPLLSADKRFTISVNVTPHHFMQPGFADELRKHVNAAGVAYRQVCVELTEREPFEDLGAAAGVVSTLQGYGFKLALDDVGIGHSGLSHLQGLGANTIKIDKFFVDTVGRDATANSIIQMLVRLAHELGMDLVAEGIESSAQLDALIECGVERGQGYVVSPPVAIDQFKQLFEANRATAEAPKSVSAA